MRLRPIVLPLLAALLLVPTGASASAATTTEPGVHAVSATFKTSAHQRRQAARLGRLTRVPAVPAPVSSTPVQLAVTSYSDRVLALTNVQRTSRGLRPLAFSRCADGYADRWASALSRAGALSHQPLSPILTACSARQVGENVAFGNVTPQQLVDMWMASPGHRANLLKPDFTHLGVGAVSTATGRVYGVQVFVTL